MYQTNLLFTLPVEHAIIIITSIVSLNVYSIRQANVLFFVDMVAVNISSNDLN